MKTTFDIVDLLIPIINVASVKATIDGTVHREKKPINSELADITIGSLPISGDHADDVDLQSSTAIINLFRKNHETTGQPDITSLRSTADAVKAVLLAYAPTDGSYTVFTIDNMSRPMEYPPQPMMSFVSFRVRYWAQII